MGKGDVSGAPVLDLPLTPKTAVSATPWEHMLFNSP